MNQVRLELKQLEILQLPVVGVSKHNDLLIGWEKVNRFGYLDGFHSSVQITFDFVQKRIVNIGWENVKRANMMDSKWQ